MKSIPKNALKNPELWLKSFIENHAGQSAIERLFANSSQQLQYYSTELESLKLARGKISRKIGVAKSEGLDTSELVKETKDFSNRIKLIEQELSNYLQVAADKVAMDNKTSSANKNSSGTGKPAYFITSTQPESISPISCELVKSAEDAALYSNYVENHPGSTAYHKHEFGKLIQTCTGQECRFLLARNQSGDVCGVLPITILSTALFGTYMVSMPWFNYGGPLADSDNIANQLLHSASLMAEQADCSHAEFRETIPRETWLEQTHKVSMTLPLPNNRDSFEQKLKSSIRAQSNKAIRAGCTVKFGHKELLNDFFTVFSYKMRSLGTPIHSKQFFLALLNLLKNDASICVVKLHNKPVAVGFLIAHGKTQEIPWASSLRKFDTLGANMLLYRSILGNAAESRFDFFDFGRSSIDSPTYRFKKQWGAQAQQLYWHNWTPDGNVLALSPDSPKYKLAIALWKRMPVWLANFLGPTLIRGLP